MRTRYFIWALFASLSACTHTPSMDADPGTPPPVLMESPTPTVRSAPGVTGTAISAPGIAAQLQKPAVVLEAMNRNYNETQNNCREQGTNGPRGHYYCSGVLLRTVIDGNYNPWVYSPSAIAIGATSYSWIRHDTGDKKLYHPAGFILRNRVEALSAGVPGLETGFICLYPFDAGTTTANGHQGCALRTTRADSIDGSETGLNGNDFAWGSCTGAGVTTAAQWDAHFRGIGQVLNRQCSWNAENRIGWDAMIASRRIFTKNVWNEIMLNNYGDGNQMPKYIAAFFYDVSRAGGLQAARNFQTRMNAAGYNVPILRLDFSKATSPFSYVVADQAVTQ